ncbi:MAG: hypothetical protein FJ144_05325 [Deltaproteobacteria bacterium]|nr:hypothetical protein [Deltaproteobacteria bacterium]
MRFRSTAVLVVSSAVFLLGSLGTVRAQEIPQPLLGFCCSCAAQIKFVPDPAAPDLLSVGARFVPNVGAIIDPFTNGMTFTLENANGVIFTETIPPFQFVEATSGKKFTYKNPAAKTAGGIASVVIQERSDAIGGFSIEMRAYGDLSAATLSNMVTSVVIGASPFFDVGDWEQRDNGWRRKFPTP